MPPVILTEEDLEQIAQSLIENPQVTSFGNDLRAARGAVYDAAHNAPGVETVQELKDLLTETHSAPEFKNK